METLTEQDYVRMFESQKEGGLNAAAELGLRIIDRAKWCEETERDLPYLIADYKSRRFHVRFEYEVGVGDSMSFSLVDLEDPDFGVHRYHIHYMGDTGAFVMELIREMAFIYSLHDNNEKA